MSNCMQCYFLDFTDPFEVQDFDVRAAITVSAHSEEYNQDSAVYLFNNVRVRYNAYVTIHGIYVPEARPGTPYRYL